MNLLANNLRTVLSGSNSKTLKLTQYGQSLVEISLIIALICVVSIVALTELGEDLKCYYVFGAGALEGGFQTVFGQYGVSSVFDSNGDGAVNGIDLGHWRNKCPVALRVSLGL